MGLFNQISFDSFFYKNQDLTSRIQKQLSKISHAEDTLFNIFQTSVQKMEQDIKLNPELEIKFLQERPIVQGFIIFQKNVSFNKKIFFNDLKNNFFLYSFFKNLESISRVFIFLRDERKKTFLGHIKSHLNKCSLPLEHELSCYINYAKQGFDVIYADVEHSADRFDYLIVKNNIVFNVECKSLMIHAGFPIIETEVIKFKKMVTLSIR